MENPSQPKAFLGHEKLAERARKNGNLATLPVPNRSIEEAMELNLERDRERAREMGGEIERESE